MWWRSRKRGAELDDRPQPSVEDSLPPANRLEYRQRVVRGGWSPFLRELVLRIVDLADQRRRMSVDSGARPRRYLMVVMLGVGVVLAHSAIALALICMLACSNLRR